MLALFDQVVNAHDAAAIQRFTTWPQITGTRQGLLGGFPDLRFDVVWTMAEGDRVVSFIEMTGTQRGPFLMV